MKNEEYLIKYLEEKFDNLDGRLHRIEKQTTKTNGRVTKLEEWKTLQMGAAVVISFAIGIAIKLV